MREEKNDNICPMCRFPKRKSGHVFIKNTQPSEYVKLEELRCVMCRHLPDYEITSIRPPRAKIIYRNFDNSVKYFEDTVNWLKSKGFKVKNTPTVHNTSEENDAK